MDNSCVMVEYLAAETREKKIGYFDCRYRAFCVYFITFCQYYYAFCESLPGALLSCTYVF